MRAIASFSVSFRRRRLRVRVMPSIDDVHRECWSTQTRFTTRQFVKGRGRLTPAFTAIYDRADPQLVFSLDGWTPGLVAHEVVHALLELGLLPRDVDADEPLARAVGEFTDKIVRRLQRLEAPCA